jgi:hypothetical protein
MAAVDHLVVSAATLDEGAAWVEDFLGVPTAPGGRHPLMATHNRLLRLGDGEYLEIIAVEPDQPAPPHPRWFRLDRFAGAPRLTNWVARVADIDATLAAAPTGAGRATDLQRGDLRWRMAVPGDGRLPFDDVYPGLIEWQGDIHPAARLPDRGCRLRQLVLRHPEPEALDRVLPLRDPRVTIEEGAPGLSALISTPSGERLL